MATMKRWLQRIGYGFLTGIGFAAAVVAALWIWEKVEVDGLDATGIAGSYKAIDEKSGLVITKHREMIDGGSVAILGTLKNGGVDTWQSVRLTVELMNDAGVVQDICNDYVPGHLAPSSERNFKVSCGGCRNAASPAHTKYTIRIDDASFVTPRGAT